MQSPLSAHLRNLRRLHHLLAPARHSTCLSSFLSPPFSLRTPAPLKALLCGLLLLAGASAAQAASGPPQDALDHWYFRAPYQINRVRFVGGLFVGLGNNGLLVTSPDGTVWTARNSGTSVTLRGVAYGRLGPLNQFVAVGAGGTIVTSSDAITWGPMLVIGTSQDLNDVCCLNNTFVATATATAPGQANVFVLTYRPGNMILCTGATFPNNPDTGFPLRSSAIGVAGTNFVTAAGSDFAYDIWRSGDGASWANVGWSDQVVDGIASGNGSTIMVGWEGWPRVSTDQGASWLAVASSNISSNVYQPPDYRMPMVGSDIAFGNGTFLVARSFLANGFLTTTNGLTWTNRSMFSGSRIESVAYGNGTFIACCAGGAYGATDFYPPGIYQSDPVAVPWLTLTQQTNPAAVVLHAGGEVGRAYRLQTSTDLKNWTDRETYTNSAAGYQLTDPVAADSTQLFYRVVSP